MVFAHVGFAADGQHDDLKVDYSKTSMQVFTDCAQYLAYKHGIGTLVACVGDSKSTTRLKDLPSWVPDWTNSIPTTFLGQLSSQDPHFEPPLAYLQEKSILVARIFPSDEVLFVSSRLSVKKIPNNIRLTVSSKLPVWM